VSKRDWSDDVINEESQLDTDCDGSPLTSDVEYAIQQSIDDWL